MERFILNSRKVQGMDIFAMEWASYPMGRSSWPSAKRR
jgi:hypothetical protein